MSKRMMAIVLIMASIPVTGAIACTSYPQSGVANIEGIQDVRKLFQKYRAIDSESPDQLTILKQNMQLETFNGKITEPIKDRRVQMHLAKRPLFEKDTYVECILRDPNQVFSAKVEEHVTISGRLSDFSRSKIEFAECEIQSNHTN